jgi:hypothetical protein
MRLVFDEKKVLIRLQLSNQTKTNLNNSQLIKFTSDVKKLLNKKDINLLVVEKE